MDIDRRWRGERGRTGAAGNATRLPAFIAALSAALVLGAAAPAGQARVAHVTDGDTFRLASGERIRIAGIDAPETQRGRRNAAAKSTPGASLPRPRADCWPAAPSSSKGSGGATIARSRA